jgi:hypothetical protein
MPFASLLRQSAHETGRRFHAFAAAARLPVALSSAGLAGQAGRRT